MINTVISGRYVLLEKIGMGGMATVYKARDNREKRTVAVKILDNKLVNDRQKISGFFREVEVMSRINHENCVRIYDHGIDGTTYYIVMEYVNGVTLSQIIENSGPLAPSKAVKYAVQILTALNEAHKNNIIHRDIKPQNILVDRDGIVKVADFGISRLTDAKSHSITNGEMVLGSVHYVSPEQAQGEPVDGRSDLYSAGVVIYEMLTGRVPFDADMPMRIVYMHVNEPPESMRVRNRSISVGLDEAVLKALSKNPADRFNTAAEMSRSLKKALKHPEGGIVSAKSPIVRLREYLKTNGQNAVLIIAAIVTLGAMLVFGYSRVVDMFFKVDVPRVTDMKYDQAIQELKDEGLSWNVEYTFAGEASEGRVISQQPAAGSRINRNRTVTLIVSQGLEPVELPDIVGASLSEALKTLADYGFPEVPLIYDVDETAELDTVLAQSPEAGLVSPDSHVVLTVNSSPVELPVLCGKPLAQVLDILESLKLESRIITAYSPDEQAGIVLLQSPAPGERLLRGTTVTIAVTLDSEEIYYCNYNIRVPLRMRVRAVLKSPSGLETLVYDAEADIDDIITLQLTSDTPGTHLLTVYYGSEAEITEKLEFK